MKKTIKSRLKRDQILLSAVDVINQKGYHGTTMEGISTELGMTKGSLYYYFKNKKDLMFQCHKLVLSLAIKEVEDLVDEDEVGSIEETLRNMIDVHIEYAVEEKEIFNMIIEPKQAFNKEQLQPVLQLRKYYSSLYDQVIERGIANGEFNVQEPFFTRMIMLGAMNWTQQWYRPDGTISMSDLKRNFGDYMIKLLM